MKRDPAIGDRWRLPTGTIVVVNINGDGVHWRFLGGTRVHTDGHATFLARVERGRFEGGSGER